MFNLRMAIASMCFCALIAGDALAQRKLAPGVLKVIPPRIDARSAHSLPMPLPGLKAEEYQPNFPPKSATLYGQTRHIVMFRDVWQHEFAFLGLRQLEIEAENERGQKVPKNVWYMVYRIRNVGAGLSHEQIKDPKFGHLEHQLKQDPESLDVNTLSDRFFGRFYLEGWVQDAKTGMYSRVRYADQVSPAVVKYVQQAEDPEQPLLNKIEMASQILERVPANTDQGGVWGVAIWYNVDPRIDFASVKVYGLSNAYRIDADSDGKQTFRYKTLQLNFWRAGDTIEQSNDYVDYGIPLVDEPDDQIQIARRYELPGPVIRGERLNQATGRRTTIFETDAEVNFINFNSAVAQKLDAGEIPAGVQEGFTNSGYGLGADAKLETRVEGQQWLIRDSKDGKPRAFVMNLQPEYWEKNINGDGIRFIKRLDHLWIYE